MRRHTRRSCVSLSCFTRASCAASIDETMIRRRSEGADRGTGVCGSPGVFEAGLEGADAGAEMIDDSDGAKGGMRHVKAIASTRIERGSRNGATRSRNHLVRRRQGRCRHGCRRRFHTAAPAGSARCAGSEASWARGTRGALRVANGVQGCLVVSCPARPRGASSAFPSHERLTAYVAFRWRSLHLRSLSSNRSSIVTRPCSPASAPRTVELLLHRISLPALSAAD